MSSRRPGFWSQFGCELGDPGPIASLSLHLQISSPLRIPQGHVTSKGPAGPGLPGMTALGKTQPSVLPGGADPSSHSCPLGPSV